MFEVPVKTTVEDPGVDTPPALKSPLNVCDASARVIVPDAVKFSTVFPEEVYVLEVPSITRVLPVDEVYVPFVKFTFPEQVHVLPPDVIVFVPPPAVNVRSPVRLTTGSVTKSSPSRVRVPVFAVWRFRDELKLIVWPVSVPSVMVRSVTLLL